jgi:hypothetical protein
MRTSKKRKKTKVVTRVPVKKKTTRTHKLRKTKSQNGIGTVGKYKTREAQIRTLKTIGNIITFKKPIPSSRFGSRQIGVMEFYEGDDGKVKLIGSFYSSPLYASIDKLIAAVDWKWMHENIWD